MFINVMQVSLVAEERDRNICRVQELEASVAELKHAAGKICGNPRHKTDLLSAFNC